MMIKYDYTEIAEKINYYKDKAFNLRDREILLLLIADLINTVMELESELDDEIFGTH